ncbi:WD repeat-containing protein 55 [Exaiptasia diaphana]|nr:WD repeat-containing protein 55 [Exaiptasia diaphana]
MANAMEDGDGLVPEEIKVPSQVFDVAFHPQRNVIAVAQIDGPITIHSFSTQEQNKMLMELTHHKKACRAVSFTEDGKYLLSVSKDKSLQAVDMNTGSVALTRKKAHESPINCVKVISEYLVATGDDNGGVKLEDKSDNMETELLSVTLVKGGRKVICGTGEGALNIFTWGEWGDISDRFPGHPQSVDACVAISDNVVCTGSMDGIIRAIHILPNRLIGPVGEHSDFPIERIRLSPDENLLASCSHDQTVKFWDIEHLRDTTISPGSKKSETVKSGTSSNFFADL